MADNVTLNSMSGGSVVATDDAGAGGQVQIVKLAYSADGSRTHVDADTDGLKVKVSNATVTVALGSALPAGSNVIGGVTQSGTWNVGITGTPTVTVGNASIPVTDNGGSLTVDGTVGVSGTVTVATHAVTQSGTWTVGVQGTGAADIGKAEDAAFTSGDVGVMALAVRNNNAATTLTSADADYSPIAVDAAGVQFVKSPYRPTPYKLNSAASTNATSVSATANTLLYGYYISNTNAAVRYVKFYNKASAPTVGTDTPVLVLAIPGSGAANVSFPAGINFTTGLAFATTTGAADSDTGAVAANEVIVNLVYATY